jgi:hypothetical protein
MLLRNRSASPQHTRFEGSDADFPPVGSIPKELAFQPTPSFFLSHSVATTVPLNSEAHNQAKDRDRDSVGAGRSFDDQRGTPAGDDAP